MTDKAGPLLAGRTVVVTGAARGVGRAIAEACGRHGAKLVLGDILADEGEKSAGALRQTGLDARFEPVDLAQPQSIETFAKGIAAREGAIHGLVNNAAITNSGGPAFDALEIEAWDRVMQVNVRGTWLMTRAMAPLLLAGGTGRIVNIASDTALWGPPRLLAYVTSKGAVISMTRSLARELGPCGIGVVAIAPGIMRNEATDYVPRERHAEYENGRAVPGPQFPTDIVDLIAFLLAPSALALTGQVLPANNGFVFT